MTKKLRSNFERGTSFWAVRRAFEACARRRPIVVCFEDVHWAEPMLLDLVEYLVGWSRDAPILLVCLARPELVERRPTLIAPHPNSDALALEPLTARDTAALIELVSGERVRVDHPEALVIRGGVAVFVNAEGAPSIFDHEGVSRVIADSPESNAA